MQVNRFQIDFGIVDFRNISAKMCPGIIASVSGLRDGAECASSQHGVPSLRPFHGSLSPGGWAFLCQKQHPARDKVCPQEASYDEPSLACIRRPGLRGSSKISGPLKSSVEPGISEDRRPWTNLAIQAAECLPAKARRILRAYIATGGPLTLARTGPGCSPPSGLVVASGLDFLVDVSVSFWFRFGFCRRLAAAHIANESMTKLEPVETGAGT
jgi:hypothetical protein